MALLARSVHIKKILSEAFIKAATPEELRPFADDIYCSEGSDGGIEY